MPNEPISIFNSNDPDDIAWRSEQAHASAAIEGIERDPELAAYVKQMDAEGVSPEAQIKRIIAWQPSKATAAE